MSLEIREMDYQDNCQAEHFRTLLDEYARDPSVGGAGVEPQILATLPQKLSTIDHAFSMLAYVDGMPAGLANCFFGFSTFRGQPLVNIHDLVVSAGFRRRGVGAALLAGVEEKARASGCCKMTLEVLEGNQPAKRLYERSGFAGYTFDATHGHALFLEKKLA